MKVVLFCGGLGTRIREYPDNIPKPMIPLGYQPLLWHVMQYYSQHGHKDFILCLGYKANIIKDFFLNHKPEMYSDCVVSGGGEKVKLIGKPRDDWRVTLIDTGIWRNIGERLLAVRDQVADEEMFLANYSDGLTDLDLNGMIKAFRSSNKIACFLAVQPPLTFHFADIGDDGQVRAMRSAECADLWINGGYFIFRREIFDYMRDGEELVIRPFRRLMADNLLMAFKYQGFWRAIDTFRDRQILEEMIERGETPWSITDASVRNLVPVARRIV